MSRDFRAHTEGSLANLVRDQDTEIDSLRARCERLIEALKKCRCGCKPGYQCDKCKILDEVETKNENNKITI